MTAIPKVFEELYTSQCPPYHYARQPFLSCCLRQGHDGTGNGLSGGSIFLHQALFEQTLMNERTEHSCWKEQQEEMSLLSW